MSDYHIRYDGSLRPDITTATMFPVIPSRPHDPTPDDPDYRRDGVSAGWIAAHQIADWFASSDPMVASFQPIFRNRYATITANLVNLFYAVSDVVAFSIPFAKYKVTSISGFSASANSNPTTKIGLYTGQGGTGTTVLTATPVALTTGHVTTYAAVDDTAQLTAPLLYLRNTVMNQSALSASFMLQVLDLTA